MKKAYLFSIVSLFLLSACLSMGPPPETLNQRLAMVHISYGVLLDKAIMYKQEGRLTATQSDSLTDLFNDIELAIASSQEAIKLADSIRFNQQSTVILKSLTLIRTILTESEEPPT